MKTSEWSMLGAFVLKEKGTLLCAELLQIPATFNVFRQITATCQPLQIRNVNPIKLYGKETITYV